MATNVLVRIEALLDSYLRRDLLFIYSQRYLLASVVFVKR